MARVVLVTGVSRYLGGRFADILHGATRRSTRVIGVDVVPPPHDLGYGRVRPRRHPQPGHREGHRAGRASTPSCT